jgi:hypothetical protein|tara:strand:+ start:327 stop:479 length:153 start_codon:yes stop_codon:yes gene_type:complete
MTLTVMMKAAVMDNVILLLMIMIVVGVGVMMMNTFYVNLDVVVLSMMMER